MLQGCKYIYEETTFFFFFNIRCTALQLVTHPILLASFSLDEEYTQKRRIGSINHPYYAEECGKDNIGKKILL